MAKKGDSQMAIDTKWCRAEELLWRDLDFRSATTIGHLCREALQDFFGDIVMQLGIGEVDPDKSHTVARAKAMLAHVKSELGDTSAAFLDALLVYSGTLSDLVQRQEHGAQREDEDLIWDDARRVVFYTALVMYEFHTCMRRMR
jgi:hypothetical protein